MQMHRKCITCKHFSPAGDFDLCCYKQIRRLTYANDDACEEGYEECEEKERVLKAVDHRGTCPWCSTVLRVLIENGKAICPICKQIVVIKT